MVQTQNCIKLYSAMPHNKIPPDILLGPSKLSLTLQRVILRIKERTESLKLDRSTHSSGLSNHFTEIGRHGILVFFHPLPPDHFR